MIKAGLRARLVVLPALVGWFCKAWKKMDVRQKVALAMPANRVWICER
jgi:hypothetical protein